MNKEKIYTLMIFVLTLIVVLAGWLFTEYMLKQKEISMLSQRGELHVDSANLGVFDDRRDTVPGGTDEVNTLSMDDLSEEEIEEILTVWEMGGRELPHQPKAGQLNMEQAIDVGKKWAECLAEQGILPSELMECNYDDIGAKLLSPELQAGMDESLLSYWSVQLTEGDTVIRLTIHAVYGDVWRADITMKEHDGMPAEYREEEVLKIAFPFLGEGGQEQVRINNAAYQNLGEGLVYAGAAISSTVVSEEAPVMRINLWLCTREGMKKD